ncbi:hypothetical protein I79_017120 [Cricetulus griseus]|uniref:Uncharacterized protein n=1 Tax=Cricetulus griseus TaxID=10029 RepID=G3I173_CRIGR|nr:hypothetical protein I79_017120 [Cricetulus griseus]
MRAAPGRAKREAAGRFRRGASLRRGASGWSLQVWTVRPGPWGPSPTALAGRRDRCSV